MKTQNKLYEIFITYIVLKYELMLFYTVRVIVSLQYYDNEDNLKFKYVHISCEISRLVLQNSTQPLNTLFDVGVRCESYMNRAL